MYLYSEYSDRLRSEEVDEAIAKIQELEKENERLKSQLKERGNLIKFIQWYYEDIGGISLEKAQEILT